MVPLYAAAGISVFDITTSSRYGYTWFRIPKNGTHSIMQMLMQKAPPDINSSYVPYFPERHEGRFRFCVIRNPWDRLVSVYSNKVSMRLMYPECWDRDFTYFVSFVSMQNLNRCDAHLRRQTALFPCKDVDYIARVENFSSDMDHVLNEVLNLGVTIVWEGAIEHPDYRTYYNDETRALTAELYADDIAFGDYKFDG